MVLVNIPNTDVAISHSFGKERFTGVIGIKAAQENCPNDILLLTYIDGKLTGQFMPHVRTLRSLTNAEDLIEITQDTIGGQKLIFTFDSGPINIESGKYNIQYFPSHDVYYAAAQYTALNGGCSCVGDCNYIWLVESDTMSLESLYTGQLYAGGPYDLMDVTKEKLTACRDESSLSEEEQALRFINLEEMDFGS